MAILFCRAQVIKRSEGRSAVACAAYRGGVTLTDERTGQLHDYSRKQGILAEGILAPEKAPAWAKDPQELWNRVEASENRKDAQLARELVIALPHELDDQHREYLVKNVLRHATRQGMVAHYAIHAPGREGDERNHHAHIMLTLRRMTPEGFEATKAREWNEKQALGEWKRTIEHETNRMMERQGLEQRVSVELAEGQRPTRHLGPRAAFLERRGIKTELGEQNREAAAANTRRQTLEHLREQTAREIAAIEAEERQKTAELEAQRSASRAFQELAWEIKETAPPPAAATDGFFPGVSANWNLNAANWTPSNENRPEAHQKQREHVPRTPAARAFEKAQQPERSPQPEPPRRRTEQREAFNAAARPPEGPEASQQTRRQGEGERAQALTPANDGATQRQREELEKADKVRRANAEYQQWMDEEHVPDRGREPKR